MHVIEVLADDPYRAQAAISSLPIVASVTQLGIRLRVLVPQSVADALERIEKALREHKLAARTHIADATLEDVFVAVTLKPEQLAA